MLWTLLFAAGLQVFPSPLEPPPPLDNDERLESTLKARLLTEELGDAERARLYLWLGALRAERGEDALARATFAAALRYDRGATLPGGAAVRAERLLCAARASALAAPEPASAVREPDLATTVTTLGGVGLLGSIAGGAAVLTSVMVAGGGELYWDRTPGIEGEVLRAVYWGGVVAPLALLHVGSLSALGGGLAMGALDAATRE